MQASPQQIYPHIIPKIEDWPVAIQSRERGEFIKRLNDFVISQLLVNHSDNLYDIVSKTYHLESQRIKLMPWKVDPEDEKEYWKSINNDLEASLKREDQFDAQLDILKRIVNRYNEEIVGSFKPNTFRFSRIFLLSLFKRIFNKYFAKGQWRWGGKKALQSKIKLKGNVDKIRSLFEKGTVVVLPTHYSNLDSIMLGYAMDSNAGMPFFSYGAGLNLFNVEIVGYFINRLGAFRVDRRKKNPIYLECLKSMTGFSILEGVNCLFFPGGTRSRNGQTEDRLKLGLLGATIEAQRIHIEKGNNKKIFVVPLNLGYHFVLEAKHLIDQHLQGVGKEKYKRDRNVGLGFTTILRFIKDLYTRESEFYMSFGDPLDVFGNAIDDEGNSIDKFGNKVALDDYFTLDGQLTGNTQREGVYAKVLSESVIASYKKFNVILSSNLVSFVAFHLIYQEFLDQGLISLVNQKNKKYVIDVSIFTEKCCELISNLKQQSNIGEITLSYENWDNPTEIIKEGVTKLGICHVNDILIFKDDKTLVCADIKLLYFYHNRLINYDFEGLMGWSPVEVN